MTSRFRRLAALVMTLTLSGMLVGVPRAEAATQPAAPSTVKLVGSDPTRSATLSWSPPATDGGSPVTGYRVSRNGTDSRGEGAWSALLPATARSQVFTLLRPGDTYALTVQAVNAVGTSPAAGSTVAIAPTMPGPPTVTTSQAFWSSVAWTPPAFNGGSPVTAYKVSRTGTDLNGVGPISVTVPASASRYDFGNLRYGAKYRFSVAAVNRVGIGESASGVVYQVPAPPASTDLVVTQHPETRSASLSWRAPYDRGDPITRYYITWGNIDRAGDPGYTDHGYVVLTGQTRRLTLGPLEPGASYEVDLVAENNNDAGGGARTTFTVPSAPTAAQQVALTANTAAQTMTLTWSRPTSTGGTPITGYRIVTSGSGSAGLFTRELITKKPARSATIKADPNTPYTVSVEALNAIGPGPSVVTTTTTGSVPPGRPRAVMATKDDSARIATLYWAAPVRNGGSAISGYRVMRRGRDADGNRAETFVVDGAVRSQSFVNLKARATYTLTVQAITAAGSSPKVRVKLRVS